MVGSLVHSQPQVWPVVFFSLNELQRGFLNRTGVTVAGLKIGALKTSVISGCKV
jgi:hypothetical protein